MFNHVSKGKRDLIFPGCFLFYLLISISFYPIFLFNSILCSSQVGDVVLVQDESVIENEFKMIGLDTLVCLFGLLPKLCL